jgi:hypothetical protein
MQRQRLTTGLILALVIAIPGGTWFLRRGSDAPSATATAMQVAADCDSAQRACAARGGDLEFELRLGPPVRPMEAFDIRLHGLRGTLAADAQVSVAFEMRAMDMGLNRYRLERAADGSWQGRAILPVCTTGRSDWLARVEIVQHSQRWIAELPFEVK